MYKTMSPFIYGFHGCDASTKVSILRGESFFKTSTNDYDWLGTGIYFWENDPQRALEFAEDAKNNPRQSKGQINEPAVIGAVIDLGNCLDLSNRKSIELVKLANAAYLHAVGGEEFAAKNKGKLPDMRGRYRDCAVINALHHMLDGSNDFLPYDTVRSFFYEGDLLYTTSAFYEFTHSQVCVRNPNCIKAIFDPRDEDTAYRIP